MTSMTTRYRRSLLKCCLLLMCLRLDVFHQSQPCHLGYNCLKDFQAHVDQTRSSRNSKIAPSSCRIYRVPTAAKKNLNRPSAAARQWQHIPRKMVGLKGKRKVLEALNHTRFERITFRWQVPENWSRTCVQVRNCKEEDGSEIILRATVAPAVHLLVALKYSNDGWYITAQKSWYPTVQIITS